jgi:hypothetical protein
VSAGFALACSVPAFAAAPEAPSLEATGRKATEVSLRGVLYPNAPGEPGSYGFLYKQSAAECTGGSKTSSGIATGNQFEEVFQTLSGLLSGKQYTICLSVTSPGGTTLSAPVTVTTAIPPEAPGGLKAEPVAATTATLHGVLNPLVERKSEPGSYEFLYKRSASECEGESATASTAAGGAQSEAVSAPVTGLLPHTTYTFCLRATNAAGEAAVSAPSTFMTPVAAPKVEEASVSNVASSSATLQATINPEGAETSYVFEYASAGGSFVPVPEAEGKGSLPEGDTGVPVSVHVQAGLLVHTAYQFRVVASNSVETLTGETVSFTTQPRGGTLELPDRRQWELVSPPNKLSGKLLLGGGAAEEEGLQTQAAEDGGAFAYAANGPTELGSAGYQSYVPILSSRGPDGWTSHDMSSPANGVVGATNGAAYPIFSSDLSSALVEFYLKGYDTLLLSPLASEETPYIRRQAFCEAPGSDPECFLPVLTGKEGYADVPPGTKFGAEEGGFQGVHPEAVSPDLHHVVFSSGVPLTSEPFPVGQATGEIYEWSEGAPPSEAVQLVSLLPAEEGGAPAVGGALTGAGAFNGGKLTDGNHTVSDDGSRVFWGVTNGGLYVRDTVKKETLRIGAYGHPNGNEAGAFDAASSDGSRVIFTEAGNLEVCDIVEVAAKLACHTSRLAPEIGNVIGASEDGSYVYFEAGAALAPGATPGKCGSFTATASCTNLYVNHDGKTTFIAGLSRLDESLDVPKEGNLVYYGERVSPNGRFLAFMSNRSLTGYDNRDAVSGKPDMEVYVYDTLTSHLACVSCDPTGARPIGVLGEAFVFGAKNERPNLVNIPRPFSLVKGEETEDLWFAANLPVSPRPSGFGVYQTRLVTDSGQLFFNTIDALVPQDVNSQEDAYEFEPQGVGTCVMSNSTFNSSTGGCVSLISAGTSPEESAVLDTGDEGGDVFFATASKLTSQDVDTAIDVYDAHACSASSPCFVPPVSPPECSTADSCKSAQSPQPSVFGAPPSATFSGIGNLVQSPSAAVKSTGRSKVSLRARKLKRALRACRRSHPHVKRARLRCERQARRSYGAQASRVVGGARDSHDHHGNRPVGR